MAGPRSVPGASSLYKLFALPSRRCVDEMARLMAAMLRTSSIERWRFSPSKRYLASIAPRTSRTPRRPVSTLLRGDTSVEGKAPHRGYSHACLRR
ncbi:uncharacterized protein PSFLO_01652 [Pseudozyma flocculosa]|uniref:Uncharacterized protein n=1 Tax=Pseudozyma flocculosa TaxID=84751 RepID=A0A5C3EYT5_9BASI|nr:uncharacterized protein PSFLO_01652 [Pseudozyma flocculosa]